jgi:hypothetical protein
MAGKDAHEEAVRQVVWQCLKDTFGWESDHHLKNRPNLIRTIVWYLDAFADDPCKTAILADGQPAVELPFRLQISDDIWLAGHLDRLVEYAGSFYVQDQKTTGSTLGGYYFKRYNPDVQMSLYTLAAKVIWKVPVQGVMIDAAQIAVGFSRFERGFSYRTDAQLEEWLAHITYRISQQGEAEVRGWPMNDTACMLYGGCPFMEVCSKDPAVREDFLRTGFEKLPIRNPLEA